MRAPWGQENESMAMNQEVRMERMLPHQIEAAMRAKSLIYIPLGAIEYHGLHLPIGLDSLTSHGLCLRVAQEIGGMVMPPLYYGMTGSIGHHPWTILVESETEFNALLRTTLRRLQDFGVDQAVIFTGHFGRRQLAALDLLEQQWKDENHTMGLRCLSINRCAEAKLTGDHGAIFETSVLAQLHPELVQLDRLPSQETAPADDPDGNSWGEHRRDPANVLFGILGDDPRDYDAPQAEELLETLVRWFAAEVENSYLTP